MSSKYEAHIWFTKKLTLYNMLIEGNWLYTLYNRLSFFIEEAICFFRLYHDNND